MISSLPELSDPEMPINMVLVGLFGAVDTMFWVSFEVLILNLFYFLFFIIFSFIFRVACECQSEWQVKKVCNGAKVTLCGGSELLQRAELQRAELHLRTTNSKCNSNCQSQSMAVHSR